jgi:hypothetical protein
MASSPPHLDIIIKAQHILDSPAHVDHLRYCGRCHKVAVYRLPARHTSVTATHTRISLFTLTYDTHVEHKLYCGRCHKVAIYRLPARHKECNSNTHIVTCGTCMRNKCSSSSSSMLSDLSTHYTFKEVPPLSTLFLCSPHPSQNGCNCRVSPPPPPPQHTAPSELSRELYVAGPEHDPRLLQPVLATM